jgi:hypothetical protein
MRERKLRAASGHPTTFGLVLLSAAVMLGGAACSSESPECEVSGEPRDVATYVGEYAEYDTTLLCRSPFDEIGVEKDEENTLVFVGLGGSWYDSTPPSTGERQTALHQMGEELRDLIDSATGVYPWGRYVGMDGQNGCANEDYVSIYISDWDAFDGATTVIGDYLTQNDLQEEVHLTVGKICM